jgi:hypothetical protein
MHFPNLGELNLLMVVRLLVLNPIFTIASAVSKFDAWYKNSQYGISQKNHHATLIRGTCCTKDS